MLKTTAIDFGLCNIAWVCMDDESSDSYIIDGSTLSSKNADFNKRLAVLGDSIIVNSLLNILSCLKF